MATALTSLSSVIKGNPVTVRGRKRPIQILFNLEHPEGAPPKSPKWKATRKPSI
jgi:hypothetical protein